ncbi:hypothetical protein H4Q26_004594 [Puccinia striiformis f. sp. tritici PST-130]|nr:hypothetical protein H4Q26_004594 [Puccinia striiformis f. sp. tritici PST-130]
MGRRFLEETEEILFDMNSLGGELWILLGLIQASTIQDCRRTLETHARVVDVLRWIHSLK